MLLFDFFSFFVFFFFLQYFSSDACYVKQVLGGEHLFWKDGFLVFKESTLKFLEQIQVQRIVFNKKAIVKISGSATQRAHHETLLNFVASFSCQMSQE